jgi:hypothetical protein
MPFHAAAGYVVPPLGGGRFRLKAGLHTFATLAFLFSLVALRAQDWQTAFSKISIHTQTFPAHQTPPIELILTNFQPTAEIRGVILMPGAADRIIFYDWGEINLRENPTLLDAITALTNKVGLRVFVTPPFLLIGMPYDDPSDPLTILPKTRPEKLKLDQHKLPGRTYYIDRPYDRLVPKIQKVSRLRIKPSLSDPASWHFYRLSFIAYDLDAADLLRAVAYGTKTSVRIEGRRATFAERPFRQ